MKIDFIKSKKYLRVMAVLLLISVLLCSTGLVPALAEKGDKRIVRIPCGINDFLYFDKNGDVTGLYKDYLDKLAEINNWQYEYIEATWTEAVKLLEKGKIDILFPTDYTAERAETMDFSSLIGGYTSVGLFASAKSNYSYEDYSNFDGARIAVTKDSTNEMAVKAFAEEHGFNCELVYIDSSQEKNEALNSGKVDLIAYAAANDAGDGILVSIFDTNPFYISVSKGATELLRELNNGMQEIAVSYPDLLSDTMHNCLVGNNKSLQAFSKEERDFVKSGKEIVVGFYEGTEPLAYVNDDGTFGGIYIELMNKVKETYGINLVLKPISRDFDWQDLLANGDIDFYIGASAPIASLTDSLSVTNTFINYKTILITKNDCAFGQISNPVIALTYGRIYWTDYLPEALGNVEIKYYRSARDCLLAVQKGEVDGAMMNNIEYNYQSKNPRFNTLIMWENYRFNTDGGLVAAHDVDDVMLSTMNKALNCLTSDYVENETNKALNMPYNSTFSDTVYASRYIILLIILLLIAFFAIRSIRNYYRKKQLLIKEQIEEQERRYFKILAVLSYDYDAIYYTDLDNDSCEVIRRSIAPVTIFPETHKHSEALREYIENSIMPEYREDLMKWCNPQEIIKHFEEEEDFSIRYRVVPNEKHRDFYEMHFVDASEDSKSHLMVFGIRCVDDAAKGEQQQKQLLKDALEAANRANSAKSEFLSKMSHDIRTPMNAIIGMTAIAAAHAEEPMRIKDALEKINASSRHLLGLINEVLDMSKIESGTISLHEEEFNLIELLNSLVSIIQPQIIENQHTLDVHIDEIEHDEVIGDSLRIQQIFLNIVSNAIKYTNPGGKIEIYVRELPISTPKAARYEFVFKDNGIGMSNEFIERIFEPFSRAEDLRISKIQGTGLGMAIANNIVKMMNGSIKVESELGKGTTFTVEIFLSLQDESDIDISDLEGLTVLVVDDDPDACEQVCILLKDIGMKGLRYTTGQEAIEAVKNSMTNTQERIFAAILDWKIPVMDGVETAKAIKEITQDEIPIIILSAYDWTDIEKEAREAGVDTFLSKPASKSSLVRLFKNLNGGFNEFGNLGKELQGIEKSDYSGNRVLLVDDNDLNREIAKEIFEMEGLKVDEAEDGKDAFEKFAQSPEHYYSMIFMDVQMPVMNGYESTIEIRALERSDSKTVPIVAMTANAFTEDIKASKKSGMNEHLTKPIEFDKLNDVLKKYLG